MFVDYLFRKSLKFPDNKNLPTPKTIPKNRVIIPTFISVPPHCSLFILPKAPDSVNKNPNAIIATMYLFFKLLFSNVFSARCQSCCFFIQSVIAGIKSSALSADFFFLYKSNSFSLNSLKRTNFL
jgi:hypothetical protein